MTFQARLTAVGLERPDYGGRELGAVLPAALAAVGAGHAVQSRSADSDRTRLGVPRGRHVIVVVLDGLGHQQLDARRGHAPFLRSMVSERITAGFPTTTATSLSLFGTGFPSGRTGMAGYTVRNPRSGELANLVNWEGAYRAEEWQPRPSLLEEAAREGLSVTTLGKARFAGSGLTHAALRGGDFIGAERLEDRVDIAAGVARKPGISYLYWGEIDSAGHHHGWGSSEWVAALEDADRELKRLARSLPRDAVMVVTADHGMVDITGAPRWDVAEVPGLREGIQLVAGEPRATHLHLEPGVDPDAVVARWQDILGVHAAVGTRQDIVDAGLVGKMDPAVADRFGDVVVAMAGRATVVDSRTQTPKSMELIGVHGSLTPEELYVPLLTVAAD
ncbi:alkaline phosphatase family protein [Demequina zhanjiangensis]|uniref:Alkaline phosphatase family protein n=1 Tax=Demequina zhanjiangensis TaxID=3051659 RepID=A0ABT8G0Q3_9MICO|nr:nucleotide pyrophosphatase/phosphodiesterase family protein [Demequina sp. SYSU T00b26]MDN4472716.1 alkaline phosphatase family protein [Demequina sp. SYSU T00b26]